SRYFISQFAVNAGVGLAIGGLLALLGVPHAAVWAVLGGLLRFVPYVGFPAAALLAGAMAAAMVPGWELMLQTLAVFLAVELVAAYVVEPQLYGHTTGLSPFSVVVAAIFWGALWGPVGLLLSTPLTLCLVVAGRHVPSLAFLDLLLGDAPALDLSQRFYQRSISGDAVEILADARAFLKRKPLAAYCDKVVMPAAQRVILQVLAELTRSPLPARRRAAVLDGSGLGLRLRRERESVEGRWQGPLDVPPGSLMLCVSLPDPGSELSAELLVRVLRSERLDARHATVKELAEVPPDARADAVGVVFVVCSGEASAEDVGALDACLAQLPQARVVALLPAQMAAQPPRDPLSSERHHHTAYSFEEALCLVQRRPA
ncbi:AI-2E family transporter, partial [Rubrivivax gelatinosus]|uniref:AI-2E family transporter n=1 Tax=Rubrivivax gelatinosus TaxID=28068 RepID=UPI0005C20D65